MYESYTVWERKLKMWMAAVNLSDKQQALSVASLIHDKHEKHKMGHKDTEQIALAKTYKGFKVTIIYVNECTCQC